jgi:histidinol-phosphatase
VHPDLALALELADLADSISLPRFRALDLRVETKPDLTPVTDADRAVENALLERIEAARPEDGVLGEEHGTRSGAAGRRWILDPIDGTRNFVRGIPLWATLIALEEQGEPVLGVASAPALGRRWRARRGDGAFADAAPIHASAVRRIEDAVFSYASLSDGVAELAGDSWHARTFSDFWQHVLVAEGAVDAAVDHVVNVWDIAAVRVIVEEAGGRCTDLDGGPALDTGSLVSTNGHLHDEVLQRLRVPR